MGFQLSETVDRNKVFLVKRSEIEGRLDPLIALYRRKVRRFRYQTHQLAKLLKIPPRYGANEAGKTRANNEEPRYIRITDIDAHGLLKNEIGVTAEIIEPKYILKNNDILFARSGATVGKAYIHKIKNVEYPCFYAGYMIRFVFNDDMVNPDYVFSFTQLNIYKEWVQAIQRAAGQPNINAEEYKSLMVPLPPVKVQNEIASKMNAAYSAKKEKEAEAQRLLDSIDDYLLKELGIELPEKEKNTIQQRMFVRKVSEVSGSRLDPLFHSGDIYRFVEDSKYDFQKLRNLSKYMKSGFAAGKNEQSRNAEDIIQIRPTNINEESEFVFDRNVYINRNDLNTHKADILNTGEVLFNNTNSQEQVGKTIYFNLKSDYLCSNHITRIKTSNNLNPQYLADLFNLYKRKFVFYRLCTNWNNQSGIGLDVLGNVEIPLLPLPKQNQIATHIHSIRSRAKQLREHATTELEQAKKKVEKMILGDTE